MKVKLTIEYDGRPFCGWQEQAGQASVQEEVRRAIEMFIESRLKQNSLPVVPQTINLSGSGRTDSGVHALGQVASFSWPGNLPLDTGELLGALNGITPKEIAITTVDEVPDTFDARRTRHRKQYSYRYLLRRGAEGFYSGRAWRVPEGVDVGKMCIAARHFAGHRDFSSFRAKDCIAASAVRTIHLSELCREDNGVIRFVVQGNGFLKQMIRIMAGTLIGVGKGILDVDDIPRILEARSREAAGPTAPAQGLTLDWVKYDVSAPYADEESEDDE